MSGYSDQVVGPASLTTPSELATTLTVVTPGNNLNNRTLREALTWLRSPA
jgi:hypothetical protein